MNQAPKPTVDTLPEIRAYHVRIGSGHIHCVHGRSPEHAIAVRLRDEGAPIHPLLEPAGLRVTVWNDGRVEGPVASKPENAPESVYGPIGSPLIYELTVDFAQLSPAE